MASGSDQQNTLGTTTSTSYTATLTGGTACGLAFVAPPSGIVFVHSVVDQTITATAYGFSAIEVRTGGIIGAGGVFLAALDSNALRHADPNFVRACVITPVVGLTPGSTYNVRLLHKAASGTLSTQNKILALQPQP
jgi:hypothetical protein